MNDQTQQTNPGLEAMQEMEYEQFKKWQREQGAKECARPKAKPGEPNGWTLNMLCNIRAALLPACALALDEVSRPETPAGLNQINERADELLESLVPAVRAAVPADPANPLKNMTWVQVRTEMITVLRTLADRLDNANGNATRRSETTTGPTEPAHVRANLYPPPIN